MEMIVKKGGEETRNDERAGWGERQVLKRDGAGKMWRRDRELFLKWKIPGGGTGNALNYVNNPSCGRAGLATLACFWEKIHLIICMILEAANNISL